MPLTKQIIANVIRDVVRSELEPVNSKLSDLETGIQALNNKVNNLADTVADFSGEIKASREEQTILASQMSDRTDRIEKLEIKVFGSSSTV